MGNRTGIAQEIGSDRFGQVMYRRQSRRSAERQAISRKAWAQFFAASQPQARLTYSQQFAGSVAVRIGLNFDRNADGVTVARINRMGGLPDKGTAGTMPLGFPYSQQIANAPDWLAQQARLVERARLQAMHDDLC